MTNEPGESSADGEPGASRPELPAAYGIPAGPEGLLDWRWAEARLERAKTYWVATVRPDGRPHTVPVWGVWLDRRFYFGGGGVKARNLAANPAVVVHLESGEEVVIVEGVYDPGAAPSPALRIRLREASVAKYGFAGGDAEGGEAVFAVRPRTVIAWHHLPHDATRWRFDPAGTPPTW